MPAKTWLILESAIAWGPKRSVSPALAVVWLDPSYRKRKDGKADRHRVRHEGTLDYKLNETLEAESHLPGRVTYESFASAWPKREGPFAEKINANQELDRTGESN